eukprot:scaffold168284_cov21-Tisochrysis_lutea.AAC.1
MGAQIKGKQHALRLEAFYGRTFHTQVCAPANARSQISGCEQKLKGHSAGPGGNSFYSIAWLAKERKGK